MAKVSFEGNMDLGRIAGAYPALGGCSRPVNLIDLRKVASRRRVQEEGVPKKQAQHGISLTSLAERHLGLPLDKTMQMSNWARRPLPESQKHYAALDAWVPLEIYTRLQ